MLWFDTAVRGFPDPPSCARLVRQSIRLTSQLFSPVQGQADPWLPFTTSCLENKQQKTTTCVTGSALPTTHSNRRASYVPYLH